MINLIFLYLKYLKYFKYIYIFIIIKYLHNFDIFINKNNKSDIICISNSKAMKNIYLKQ